jgi:hypothetical protein
METEFMLRNSPPKAFWRAISVQITARKPAETTLTGKSVCGQSDIPHQTHFWRGIPPRMRTPNHIIILPNHKERGVYLMLFFRLHFFVGFFSKTL